MFSKIKEKLSSAQLNAGELSAEVKAGITITNSIKKQTFAASTKGVDDNSTFENIDDAVKSIAPETDEQGKLKNALKNIASYINAMKEAITVYISSDEKTIMIEDKPTLHVDVNWINSFKVRQEIKISSIDYYTQKEGQNESQKANQKTLELEKPITFIRSFDLENNKVKNVKILILEGNKDITNDAGNFFRRSFNGISVHNTNDNLTVKNTKDLFGNNVEKAREKLFQGIEKIDNPKKPFLIRVKNAASTLSAATKLALSDGQKPVDRKIDKPNDDIDGNNPTTGGHPAVPYSSAEPVKTERDAPLKETHEAEEPVIENTLNSKQEVINTDAPPEEPVPQATVLPTKTHTIEQERRHSLTEPSNETDPEQKPILKRTNSFPSITKNPADDVQNKSEIISQECRHSLPETVQKPIQTLKRTNSLPDLTIKTPSTDDKSEIKTSEKQTQWSTKKKVFVGAAVGLDITSIVLLIPVMLEQFNVIKNNLISPGKNFNTNLTIALTAVIGACIVGFAAIAITAGCSKSLNEAVATPAASKSGEINVV